MQKSSEDFGEQDEDIEIQNLPLYTQRKADGIYRYRRRVPKNLVERVGRGYLYRNLGRTKKDVVGNWPDSMRYISLLATRKPISFRYFKTSPEIIQLDDMLVGGLSLLIWTAFGTTLLD